MAKQKVSRRALITARDNKHLSTEDLNARILAARNEQHLAEDDVLKTSARLKSAQRIVATQREYADALETLIDARN